MSGTIQYDESGAVDPNLDAMREAKEEIREAQGQDNYTESEGHVADPTAMTGTLETTDTSGVMQSADDVSEAFHVADEQFAEGTGPTGVEEGAIGTPAADPAASGENLDPVTGAEANDGAKGEATTSSSDFDASKNPGDYKVAEILDFLKRDDTSDADVKKIQKAEKDGQGRKTIVDFSR